MLSLRVHAAVVIRVVLCMATCRLRIPTANPTANRHSATQDPEIGPALCHMDLIPLLPIYFIPPLRWSGQLAPPSGHERTEPRPPWPPW